jgi:hypothetical protein
MIKLPNSDKLVEIEQGSKFKFRETICIRMHEERLPQWLSQKENGKQPHQLQKPNRFRLGRCELLGIY